MEQPPIKFFVYGEPRPGGSKRHIGGGRMIDAGKHTKAWRQEVAAAAVKAFRDKQPIVGPVRFRVVFHMARPKSHFRTGKHAGLLKNTAPMLHTSKPDRTKLTRSTEDALTGIAWNDDCAVCCGEILKLYANGPRGAQIEISSVAEPFRQDSPLLKLPPLDAAGAKPGKDSEQ